MSKGYVYLIRNGDLYKIGHTSNLERRLKQLQPCVLVQSLITDRSLNLEQELHRRFQDVRLPQSEYFRLNPHQVEQVRLALGWKKPQYQPAQKPTGWKRPSQPLPEPKPQATEPKPQSTPQPAEALIKSTTGGPFRESRKVKSGPRNAKQGCSANERREVRTRRFATVFTGKRCVEPRRTTLGSRS